MLGGVVRLQPQIPFGNDKKEDWEYKEIEQALMQLIWYDGVLDEELEGNDLQRVFVRGF